MMSDTGVLCAELTPARRLAQHLVRNQGTTRQPHKTSANLDALGNTATDSSLSDLALYGLHVRREGFSLPSRHGGQLALKGRMGIFPAPEAMRTVAGTHLADLMPCSH